MHWTLPLSNAHLYIFFLSKGLFVKFDIINNMYAPSPKPLYEVCLLHFIFLSPHIRLY